MTKHIAAPWHKASFDHFFNEGLPQLFAEQMPLVGYERATIDDYTCQITLVLATPTRDVQAIYTDLPQPDQAGIFRIQGKPMVVVPYATGDDLEKAKIFCVGEQLYDYIQKRLGKAPDDLIWDAALLKAWLPLDLWINEFFTNHAKYEAGSEATDFAQQLDETNWLGSQSHLRRLYIKNRQRLFAPGHLGRACPFETPEGPNIGRFISIALGAEIRDGKLLVVDSSPEAAIGLGAAMVPLLEQNAPERLLMGTNMLRQWLVPPTPEPALVQSGNEPDAPAFWCGRNLLTAFLAWDEGTFEDGIILSESGARRLFYTHPVEPGDKLSNRHGAKGVVSQILPDEAMPRLADGTPVELIFNFISIHARACFGQIREAVLSRVAQATGKPLIIPPWHAPTEQEIRAWLVQANLPEDGMEWLTDSQSGQALEQPGTVGPVYWGKLAHEARSKLYSSTGSGRGQKFNEQSYYALREAGAFANIREQVTSSSSDHPASTTLAKRLALGEIAPEEAPTPLFHALLQALDSVGIRGDLQTEQLAFHLAQPEGATLDLACPVAHPWLREQTLTRIGANNTSPAYHALMETNTRVERILRSEAPESLVQQARRQLALRVEEYCATLLPPVQFETRVQFSGRAVLAPGVHLHLDQVGIAEELAWALFGPFVARACSVSDAQSHTVEATRKLDEIMARSWVIIHRSPAFTPQTFLAFHPVRNADRVIRLHPLVCRWLQANFDGDQVAIFLPLTGQTQQEAGARLSVAGHLERNAGLLQDLLPTNEVLWGLARLSLSEEGRQELNDIVGLELVPAGEIVTRAILKEKVQQIWERDGSQTTLEMLERLTRRGFSVTRATGASISPFIGNHLALPPIPAEDDSQVWKGYQAEVSEWLATESDYLHSDLGTQLLAVKSGAWGELSHLLALLSNQGIVRGDHDQQLAVRHGYCAGLPFTELYALAIDAREVIARVQQEWVQLTQEIHQRNQNRSFHVLARAMRAEQPAIVFAHAASIGESDPLVDRDSRLFVGLPVEQ